MLRNVLAAIAGAVATFFTIFVAEGIGHRLYPPPPGVVIDSPEAMARFIETAPTGAMVSVLLAWCVGAFVGGFVAALIARGRFRRWAELFPAVVVLVGVTGMILMIPHPLWMSVLGVVLPVPLAWLGAQCAPRSRVRPLT